MALPPQSDIDAARTALVTTRNAVTTDETQIRQYQSDIKTLEDDIQHLRDGLPAKQLAVEDAEAAAEKILRQIEEAINLQIKATDSSVLQGGTATFEAEYTTGRPSNALPNHVELNWSTGGCTIQHPGTRSSKEITVDTSSVQPGDYGISVSLRLTT
jgi:hypothetical protein